MRNRIAVAFCAVAVGPAAALPAQQGFTDAFQPGPSLLARRAKVMEQIGDGIAVIQGSAEWPGYVAFRQNAQFFYLTGVEVPRAVLVIDGKSRTSTLFIGASYRLASSEGPMLLADENARRVTGIERVVARDSVMPVLTRPWRRKGGHCTHRSDPNPATRGRRSSRAGSRRRASPIRLTGVRLASACWLTN